MQCTSNRIRPKRDAGMASPFQEGMTTARIFWRRSDRPLVRMVCMRTREKAKLERSAHRGRCVDATLSSKLRTCVHRLPSTVNCFCNKSSPGVI